jgi:hypothetical protein
VLPQGATHLIAGAAGGLMALVHLKPVRDVTSVLSVVVRNVLHVGRLVVDVLFVLSIDTAWCCVEERPFESVPIPEGKQTFINAVSHSQHRNQQSKPRARQSKCGKGSLEVCVALCVGEGGARARVCMRACVCVCVCAAARTARPRGCAEATCWSE